jgi:predicted ArsR family transcriptional regulator
MKTLELILLQLKTLGPHSVKMLAERLDITPMGIRQHLQSLGQRKLVCYEEARSKVGRPTRYWSLTVQGHVELAQNHERLLSSKLALVRELFDNEHVEKLIRAREEILYQRYVEELAEEESHPNKFHRLVRLRQSDGYMAELLEHPQGMLLVENPSPIGVTDRTCSGLCNSQLRLFRRLFGGDYKIGHTEHLISGARHCAYLIQLKKS